MKFREIKEEKAQTGQFFIEVWLIAYVSTISVATWRFHYSDQEPRLERLFIKRRDFLAHPTFYNILDSLAMPKLGLLRLRCQFHLKLSFFNIGTNLTCNSLNR